jgi:hypothetical protein
MNSTTMIKRKAPDKMIFLVILLFVITSCGSENNEKPADFRDSFIGSYTCMATYFYFDPINDTILNWSTDTSSYNTMVTIEQYQDSSLNVIIGNYNKFTCLECNGPPDYAKFFNNDSIHVFRKSGVTNNYDYYGKK